MYLLRAIVRPEKSSVVMKALFDAGFPAVTKLSVFEFDAYRSGGRNGFTTDELLRPYQGSAIHSGMVWQTPIVVYGMGTADAGKNIAEGANTYRQRVEMLVNSSNAGNNW
jgi:nitrogen regulatory protein PII